MLTAGASINYRVGAAPATLDAGLSISDSESSLIGATVSIGAGFLGTVRNLVCGAGLAITL
jgi:hypothetical protein